MSISRLEVPASYLQAKHNLVAQRLFGERLRFDEKLQQWALKSLPVDSDVRSQFDAKIKQNPDPFLTAFEKYPGMIGSVLRFNQRWRATHTPHMGGYNSRLPYYEWTTAPLFSQLTPAIRKFLLSLAKVYDVDIISSPEPRSFEPRVVVSEEIKAKYRSMLYDLGFYGKTKPSASGLAASLAVYNFKTEYRLDDGDDSKAQLTPETCAAIDKVMQYKQQAVLVAQGKLHPNAIPVANFALTDSNNSVLAYQRSGADTYVLIKNQVSLSIAELWVIDRRGSVKKRMIGQWAIKNMDLAIQQEIASYAKQGAVFLHFGSYDKANRKDLLIVA